MTTVRDATFDVLRALEMTTIFSNPGSTEISLLTNLPEDLDFVLGLHEGSVIGMAAGQAIATGRPALAVVHTTAGLGNAVGAIATARVNRAPLVVVVGQQDRRHLASEPFLAGRLEGLAGEYPVWVDMPVRPQDVPGAVGRAHREAILGHGPALVIVPMDDWSTPYDGSGDLLFPRDLRAAGGPADPAAVRDVAGLLSSSSRPAIVVGAGLDSAAGWDSAVRVAEHLGCPVYQEAFGARAGFPQDHQQFAGHLAADRDGLRAQLDAFDLVLVLGAPMFRQYPYASGPFRESGTSPSVVVSADAAEVTRSPSSMAVRADPAAFLNALGDELGAGAAVDDRLVARGVDAPGDSSEVPAPADVFARLALHLEPDAIVVEESPSSRGDLHRLVPARRPLGFVSAAMGGLGFAMPAAIGLKMGAPDRPVVAVIGDGSSLYSIQALWSAARYDVGVLFIVLANGRYAIMDRLAELEGTGPAPWPSFENISVSGLATALGCDTRRVNSVGELNSALAELVPGLSDRKAPLVLEVEVTS